MRTKLENNTATAGGVFGSIRVKPTPLFEVAVQGMAGTGVGRYGSSQLADATLKPNETLEPIRNYHGLFSLVFHPTKNWDFFSLLRWRVCTAHGVRRLRRLGRSDRLRSAQPQRHGLLQPAGGKRQQQRFSGIHLGLQLRFADPVHPGSDGRIHLARRSTARSMAVCSIR